MGGGEIRTIVGVAFVVDVELQGPKVAARSELGVCAAAVVQVALGDSY